MCMIPVGSKKFMVKKEEISINFEDSVGTPRFDPTIHYASSDPMVAGYLCDVSETLEPLRELADDLGANFKRLAFKLVNSKWNTRNYAFLILLLNSLKELTNKKENASINNNNDKKADAAHHFHGLRLPPPLGQQHIFHLTLKCIQCYVGNRGVNHDISQINSKEASTKEEIKWKRLKRESRMLSKHGRKQSQASEKKPKNYMKRSKKYSKRTQNWRGTLLLSYSKSLNLLLNTDTLKQLAIYHSFPYVSIMSTSVQTNQVRFENIPETEVACKYD